MSGSAIVVKGVSKDFVLPHHKSNSLKQVFTGLFSPQQRGYELQHALADISFEVREGEFFGIVGRNGSGKSTLLKILAGIYYPTAGTIHTVGKLVPFIELGVGFNPELTGRENVYLNGAMLGFTREHISAMYNDIVAFAELERFMDQKLKNYSSGMQVRLAFAMATRSEADILLVDEVLAVGDEAFQRKCFHYFKELKAKKKTVVFVTHDMSAVREYCDRAMLIDNSRVSLIGKPEDVSREYSLLFMDEKTSEHAKKGGGKRWGNGNVTITNVTTKVEDDEVVIRVEAEAHTTVDKVIHGLHIIGDDGAEITAMNNRMLRQPDIIGLRAGESVQVTWRILNVFNDGLFYVMLTLVDDEARTLDWWMRASSFTIRRAERSTTPILPPVTLSQQRNSETS